MAWPGLRQISRPPPPLPPPAIQPHLSTKVAGDTTVPPHLASPAVRCSMCCIVPSNFHLCLQELEVWLNHHHQESIPALQIQPQNCIQNSDMALPAVDGKIQKHIYTRRVAGTLLHWVFGISPLRHHIDARCAMQSACNQSIGSASRDLHQVLLVAAMWLHTDLSESSTTCYARLSLSHILVCLLSLIEMRAVCESGSTRIEVAGK